MITHEKWLIAAAAWNGVDVETFRKVCEKDETRMPKGSQEAWGRVFEAVAKQVRLDMTTALPNFTTDTNAPKQSLYEEEEGKCCFPLDGRMCLKQVLQAKAPGLLCPTCGLTGAELEEQGV